MIKTKKIGSVLKHVKNISDYEIIDEVAAEIGSIVAVKVISVNQNYNKLELSSGRNVELSEGDIVIGALGNRLASTGMCGYVPEELNKFDKINLLNLGGVIGLSKDHNVLMGSATECELLGSLLGKSNKALNLKDFTKVKKDLTSINKPLVAVLGTGIDSGKTTVTSFLIKSLSNYIDKICACKLAGTASQKDLYSYEDSGANKVLDFVDYGLPSTCLIDQEQVIESSVSIVNEAVKENDIVFVELGDGYHGQYGTKEIIENKQISENIKIIVICAYDVSGAVNILENLNDSGFKDCLIIISGPVTNNITAFRESLSKFGPINSEYLNIYNNANHANIFAKIINKVKSND